MRTINAMQTVCCLFMFLASGQLHAAETPEAIYQKFHDAMLAGDMDGMLALSPESERAEMAGYAPEQKQAMIAMMGKLLPRSYTVLGVKPGADANAATLYASGMGVSLFGDEPEMQYGTISMSREAGEWKVGKSSWNNKPPKNLPAAAKAPPAPAATPPTPAMQATPETPPAAPAPVAAVPVAPAPPTLPPAPPKAPEKKKPVCIIKQVMSNAEIETCRQAAAER